MYHDKQVIGSFFSNSNLEATLSHIKLPFYKYWKHTHDNFLYELNGTTNGATALNSNWSHILQVSNRIDNCAKRTKHEEKMLLKSRRREFVCSSEQFSKHFERLTKRGGKDNYIGTGKHGKNKPNTSLIFIQDRV